MADEWVRALSSSPSVSAGELQRQPMITILADDDDLLEAILAAMSVAVDMTDGGERDEEGQTCNTNTVSYRFVPSDTGVSSGTSVVGASRSALTAPLVRAVAHGGERGGGSSCSFSSTASQQTTNINPIGGSVPAVMPTTQLAACAATQQGVLVLALRSGAEVCRKPSDSDADPSGHGHGWEEGEEEKTRLSSSFYNTSVHMLLEELAAVVSVARFTCPMIGASEAIADFASTIQSSLNGTTNTAANEGTSRGVRTQRSVVSEAPLPSHLVILNVVSSLPETPSHRCSEVRGGVDAANRRCHTPTVLLDQLTLSLQESLLKMEPLYDPRTAVRDEGAVMRNTSRAVLLGGERGGAFASVRVVSIADPTADLAALIDAANSVEETGEPVEREPNGTRNGEREGEHTAVPMKGAQPPRKTKSEPKKGHISGVNLPLLDEARNRLHFLWNLANSSGIIGSVHTSSLVKKIMNGASLISPPAALFELEGLLGPPPPHIVAERVRALVLLTSTPTPPNALFKNNAQQSNPSPTTNAKGTSVGHTEMRTETNAGANAENKCVRDEGGNGSAHYHYHHYHYHSLAVSLLNEARQQWCETYVKAAVSERFYGYCTSRLSRLTMEMVKEAYASVVMDCERVCSLVLGLGDGIHSSGGNISLYSNPTSATAAAAGSGGTSCVIRHDVDHNDSSRASLSGNGTSTCSVEELLNLRGRMQEGLARFEAAAKRNEATNGGGGGNGGGNNKKGFLLASAVVTIPGAATATQRFRNAFNTIRNDRRTQVVKAQIMVHTSELRHWYESLVESRVPHQYRFWFTGHGALIVVGIVLFVVLSTLARRE